MINVKVNHGVLYPLVKACLFEKFSILQSALKNEQGISARLCIKNGAKAEPCVLAKTMRSLQPAHSSLTLVSTSKANSGLVIL